MTDPKITTPLEALEAAAKIAERFSNGSNRLHPDVPWGATNERSRSAAHIAAQEIAAAIRSLASRVVEDRHVPGVWRCAKCEFRLIQSTLNARDGTVTARDAPGEKCPNCDSLLWRVSWKDEAEDAMRIAESQMERAIKAEEELASRVEDEPSTRPEPSDAEVERVARAVWIAEAERAAPNVAKQRRRADFRLESDDTRSRWKSLARAALKAARGEPAAIAEKGG